MLYHINKPMCYCPKDIAEVYVLRTITHRFVNIMKHFFSVGECFKIKKGKKLKFEILTNT